MLYLFMTTVQEKPTAAEKPKKRKGCFFWGCLTTLGIIVVIALVLGIFVFKVPARIGLVKPASERRLSQTFDRDAAARIKADFQKAGLNTTGVDVYVIPEKNSNKSVMLTVLDASKGFRFSSTGTNDAVSDYLVKLANTSVSNNVDRVAFQYLDSEGNSLVSLTAPVDAVLKYSKGQMTRADYLKAIDAQVDISQLFSSGIP
jgi:hypothetical protein